MSRKKASAEEDLDLVKFIRNQRLSLISIFSLMTKDQRKFAAKLAESVLSEDSSSESNSDGEIEKDEKPEKISYIGNIISAKDVISRQLTQL